MADQSFNPAQVNKYILYNQDYNAFTVKIRLKGTGDTSSTLSPGNQLQCEIRYTNSKAKFYYNGHEVQQLDLNNGSSADDMNTPNSDYNSLNTLRYASASPVISSGQGDLDVINFDSNIFVTNFQDNDGLAGGPKPAFFKQTVDSSVSAIKCVVSKNML